MNRLARKLLQMVFGEGRFAMWERVGYHVTPVNFYQTIPDTRLLDEGHWARTTLLGGIQLHEDRQIELLDGFSFGFSEEYNSFPVEKTNVPYEFHYNNGVFGCVDPEILYCMIRHFRPHMMIEVGSGFSTFISAQAVIRNLEENEADLCTFIAIEPYPNAALRAGVPGLAELKIEKVQDVPLQLFETLASGDILFIDSSHVVHLNSDVRYLILEVLPRLQKGVLVHFHDIFLPREYPRVWVMERRRFWNEQYFLQAFLTFNETFEVLWAGTYMHANHAERLTRAFASYRRRSLDKTWIGPGSFWIRRIK